MKEDFSYTRAEEYLRSSRGSYEKYVLSLINKRKKIEVTIRKLEKFAKEGDTILVPGKVIGKGKISKRFNICAIKYSNGAKAALESNKCSIIGLEEAVKKKARIMI
ncbi:MAG: hypothetical protein QXL16_02905 [Candidatus Micrarchaeaceae archaeon]